MKTALVFIPNIPIKEIGFLQGYIEEEIDKLTIYITNFTNSKYAKDCIGFCSENTPQLHNDLTVNNSGWVHYNITNGTITINEVDNDLNVTCIHYNYDSFKRTEIIESKYYDDYFKTLVKLIQKNDNSSQVRTNGIFSFMLKVFLLSSIVNQHCDTFCKVLQQSTLLNHVAKDVKVLHWMLNKILLQKKLTVQTKNVIFAKVIDMLLGFLFLYYFYQYQDHIMVLILDSMNLVIKELKQLLLVLMGSPAGLKLNYAFNRTLGIFAFYNISLWRAFVQTIMPLLKCALNAMIIPGILGLSYQIALFIDILAFNTFHVYCIYVYAARLYGLQVKTLVSLWRLFIGRKYNPLRGRVDSFQYNHHQLFVGTLIFTILLFLLPTTLLYYIVFTTFRLIIILLNVVLEKIVWLLRFHSLKIVLLWICNSEKIRGAVYLEAHFKNKEFHHLDVKLRKLPLSTTVKEFTPEFLSLKYNTALKLFINKIVSGELI